MTTNSPTIDSVIGELESQGLVIESHNNLSNTWHIQADGIFVGFVVTSEELIDLKQQNRLDLEGVKSLA